MVFINRLVIKTIVLALMNLKRTFGEQRHWKVNLKIEIRISIKEFVLFNDTTEDKSWDWNKKSFGKEWETNREWARPKMKFSLSSFCISYAQHVPICAPLTRQLKVQIQKNWRIISIPMQLSFRGQVSYQTGKLYIYIYIYYSVIQ